MKQSCTDVKACSIDWEKWSGSIIGNVSFNFQRKQTITEIEQDPVVFLSPPPPPIPCHLSATCL